ncbi:MAG: hypothetical protein JXB17_08175 [Bacteroidales bacterium]|nr:hypothetical protein [Bacteroidales bacterium]
MRKNLLLMFFAFCMTGLFASQADLFSYNAEEVEAQFSELTRLENYIEENSSLSFNDIILSSEFANANISNELGNSMASGFTLDEMDWGGFLWGFCCGPCGVLIVYLQKDKRTNERMISSLIGWGVSVVVSLITNIATGFQYLSYY